MLGQHKEWVKNSLMQFALEEGKKAKTLSPPNPWVGACLVTSSGELFLGHTQRPGEAHAEIIAMRKATDAGASLLGATMYVTLEPCCHHGRTPPCTESLIKSGITQVVVGILDPDSKVSGKGIAHLQTHGIRVETGCLEESITQELLPYLVHRKKGRPYTILKWAQSLDGFIAAKDSTSKWISGDSSRERVQQLRRESQAILIGSRTASIDNPRLTVRNEEKKNQPLRVLIDSQGITPLNSHLFDQSMAQTLVATTKHSREWQSHLREKGIEVISYDNNKVHLDQLLTHLGTQGIVQAVVEGGSGLYSALLQQNLADQIIAYVAPLLIGSEGICATHALSIPSLEMAYRMKFLKSTQVGQDLEIHYSLIP